MSYVDLALEIATVAHRGQVDKAGIDYIEHPKVVASYVTEGEEKSTAYLHDVLEDADVTADDLMRQGILHQVVTAVETLTKNSKEPYFTYLEKVKLNPIARVVKLADLKHNSDLSRLPSPTEEDYKRLEKYKKAIAFLSD